MFDLGHDQGDFFSRLAGTQLDFLVLKLFLQCDDLFFRRRRRVRRTAGVAGFERLHRHRHHFFAQLMEALFADAQTLTGFLQAARSHDRFQDHLRTQLGGFRAGQPLGDSGPTGRRPRMIDPPCQAIGGASFPGLPPGSTRLILTILPGRLEKDKGPSE